MLIPKEQPVMQLTERQARNILREVVEISQHDCCICPFVKICKEEHPWCIEIDQIEKLDDARALDAIRSLAGGADNAT